jgi:hypothetical protein
MSIEARLSNPDTGITFVRSTTVQTIRREADKPSKINVDHSATFIVAEGILDDRQAEYSSRTFRPQYIYVTWENGALLKVIVAGLRVLKSGLLSDHEGRKVEHRRPWAIRGEEQPFDRSQLDGPIVAALGHYEIAVSMTTGACR